VKFFIPFLLISFMKRGLAVVFVFEVILILSLSIVSAFSLQDFFKNFWGKITGYATIQEYVKVGNGQIVVSDSELLNGNQIRVYNLNLGTTLIPEIITAGVYSSPYKYKIKILNDRDYANKEYYVIAANDDDIFIDYLTINEFIARDLEQGEPEFEVV